VAGFEDLRAAAMALPEVDEVGWYDESVWSVRKKGFAYSHKGGALLRLGRERVEFLAEASPEAFRRFALPGGHWAEVDIGALEAADLARFTREAWTGVAPARLRKSLEKP
jgi:hypothetical protein